MEEFNTVEFRFGLVSAIILGLDESVHKDELQKDLALIEHDLGEVQKKISALGDRLRILTAPVNPPYTEE